MDSELADLVGALKEAPGSSGLLRALLRFAREAADPAPAVDYLSAADPAPALSLALRLEVGDFLQHHERHAAALAWVGGEEPGARRAQARSLLALGRKAEAAAAYRTAVGGDPAMRDDDLDRELSVVKAAESAGADIIDLAGRRLGGGEVRPPRPPAKAPETIRFADIGGLAEVKQQIERRIILPFKKPGLFQKFRRRAGGGILLYGPPGCGKTMLARATAGECEARFVSIRIPEILDMYIGESEKRLAEVFARARAETPSVLFFDEVEAMAARRRFGPTAAQSTLVSTFLAELDGIDASNEGVLILAATNVPWAIDSAFRRPGRFDRVLFVPPPDEAARLDILMSHLKERPQEANLDLRAIAAASPGFSGADLAAVVEEAADLAIEESLKGEGAVRPITHRHLAEALRSRKATTIEWLTTARNYAKYANDSGLYDDVLEFLKRHSR
jgi:AAA+ superfamily predicted ATPase